MALTKRVWKWGDLLLAAITIVVAFSLWGVSALSARSAEASGALAIVRDAEGEETRYSLVAGSPPKDIDMKSGGYSYVLRFENGRIRVLEADCPDKVCVVTGWLSRPGQTAACVPGRLMVRIIADKGDGGVLPDVDVVSK